MNKFFTLLLSFIILYGCGFKPMLVEKNYDIKFEKINTKGNYDINKKLKDKLIEKSNGSKIYNIYLNSDKNKEVVSSNEKGDPQKFKLIIKVNYEIYKEDTKLVVNLISKETVYNNLTDKFELSQYEENIQNNLIENISSEILLSLLEISS